MSSLGLLIFSIRNSNCLLFSVELNDFSRLWGRAWSETINCRFSVSLRVPKNNGVCENISHLPLSLATITVRFLPVSLLRRIYVHACNYWVTCSSFPCVIKLTHPRLILTAKIHTPIKLYTYISHRRTNSDI